MRLNNYPLLKTIIIIINKIGTFYTFCVEYNITFMAFSDGVANINKFLTLHTGLFCSRITHNSWSS